MDLSKLTIRVLVQPDEEHAMRWHVAVGDTATREHDVDSSRCWCNPTIQRAYDTSNPWSMARAGELMTPDEAEAFDAPLHVVTHR